MPRESTSGAVSQLPTESTMATLWRCASAATGFASVLLLYQIYLLSPWGAIAQVGPPNPTYTRNSLDNMVVSGQSRDLLSAKGRVPDKAPDHDQTSGNQLDKDIFFSRDKSNYNNLLQARPPKYLPNYKNPCWEEREQPSSSPYTDNPFYYVERQSEGMKEIESLWLSEGRTRSGRRTRCLPFFYIAGFPKCGTSDLYNKLTLHPDVSAPPRKEIHWWSRMRVHPVYNNVWLPLNMYADLFDAAARNISATTAQPDKTSHSAPHSSSQQYHPMIVGEGSPSTVWAYDDWTRLPENAGSDTPRFFTPHYIHHVTPAARIIILVRNPTSRLYSSYLYFGSFPLSPEMFHEKVVQSIAAWDLCMVTARTHLDCLYNRTVSRMSPLSELRVGLYHLYIREWLNVFPRDQVQILRLEDYGADRSGVLEQVFDFLGLSSLGKEEITDIDQQATSNQAGSKKKTAGPMLEKTKQLLNKFYGPHNKALAEHLKDDKFEYS